MLAFKVDVCDDRRECRDLSTVWAKSVRSAQIERSWKRWHVMRIDNGAPNAYLCQLERRRVVVKNLVVCAYGVIIAGAQAPRCEPTCAMMSACVGADCRGPLVEQCRG